MLKIGKGKPLTEAVGSLNNYLQRIRTAFYNKFPDTPENYSYVAEVFQDYLIVESSELRNEPDTYYKVVYSITGDVISFTERESWQKVGLSYKLVESRKKNKLKELAESVPEILESKQDGALKVKVKVLTVDRPTDNKRIYPREIVNESIARLKIHNKLNESLGQGRCVLTGEAEHPQDKGNKRPLTTEIVYKWENIYLESDGNVYAEGLLLPTEPNGKNLITLVKNGVPIPHSLRGGGESEFKEGLEYVTYFDWFGIDTSQTASDQTNLVTDFKESKQDEKTMKKLDQLKAKFPKFFESYSKEELEMMSESDVNLIDKAIRTSINCPADKDLIEFAESIAQQNEQNKVAEINSFVESAKKEGNFGNLQSDYVAEFTGKTFETLDAAKTFAESTQKKYSKLTAQSRLAMQGFNSAAFNSMRVNPSQEEQLGIPEFAKASLQISESLISSDNTGKLRRWKPNKPESVNELWAKKYLENFDRNNQAALLAESKAFTEAELTTDLNLPVSITRTILELALPQLVATSVFDVGIAQANNETIWFEQYSQETGYTVSISVSEAVTAPAAPVTDTAIQLVGRRITPGTLVLMNVGETTTYEENVDYAVDYAEGQIWILPGSAIVAEQSLHVTAYTYSAVRKSAELAAIERLKNTLSSMVMFIRPDRIAMAISNDAVVFSRSQLGYDAVTRTLRNLTFSHARLIDTGMFRSAIVAVTRVANNSAGIWDYSGGEPTSSNVVGQGLIAKLGIAKMKVLARYYQPRSCLMSITNSDRLSTDAQFSAANARVDSSLKANGFVGRVKGMDVYEATEFPDDMIIANHPELVMRRVLANGTARLDGPHQMYDTSTNPAKLLPGREWYIEEYNGTATPIKEKGSFLRVR